MIPAPPPLPPRTPRIPRRCSAFSLVETAIATLLVGGLLVVAMNMVGASRVTQTRYLEREQARLLADDLLQQILALPYQEPSDSPAAFGLEIGETLSLRVGFDDVDDYHGHTESPPEDPGGNPVPGAERFTREVEVQWVQPDAPDTPASADTGVKRVRVTVRSGEKQLGRVVGYRTRAWPSPLQMKAPSP
ncbi:MAG: hypothetical protein AAGG38_09670 [Planctomycetota bacterium]